MKEGGGGHMTVPHASHCHASKAPRDCNGRCSDAWCLRTEGGSPDKRDQGGTEEDGRKDINTDDLSRAISQTRVER